MSNIYSFNVGNDNQPIQNPLDKRTEQIPVPAEYEKAVEKYRSYLVNRLNSAKEQRNNVYAEFGNKTYLQYYQDNEKIANTILDEPADKSEKKLSTGTIESKFTTLLSHVDNLNLTPSVMPYDQDNRSLRELGTAFTDVMVVSAEHDGGDDGGDKEKRQLRQRELLKQGTVFVMESWLTKKEIKKKLTERYNGEFAVKYTSSLKTVFEGCSRDILYGPNVYLGDITQFSMHDQPFVFTAERMSYDTAKTEYGHFENWKYVKAGPSTVSTDDQNNTIFDAKWRFSTLAANQVEIMKYYDPSRDEFMIMINGILLLPPGFPLSAVTPGGKYNIAKQTLYAINTHFAYGRSFVSSGSVFELSRALDRLLSLFELKTRKSITPPYINTTNKVIPPRVLNPGNISMGIPPNALQSIGNESQGVTSSEFQIFKELQDEIERSTISSIFQGQQAKSGATATEVIEVQRQAKLTLGLIITACTFLEVKLGYLRLYNILWNWMEPIGEYDDGSKRFRQTTRKVAIPKKGEGERMVIPIDGSVPPPEVIRMLSLQDEQRLGFPVRRIYLSPEIVREADLRWYVTVEPKEEETSSYHKLLFREMVGDAISLLQVGAQINVDGITDEFGKVYNIDKSVVFGGGNDIPATMPTGMDAAAVVGNRNSGNNMAGVSKAPQTSQKTLVNQ